MPTYEYKCQKCGHSFEAFQAITEDPLKKCPVCEGTVKRLISPGLGLIFKGSGFYVTDYKKKEAEKPEKKSSVQKEKSEKQSEEKKKETLPNKKA